MTTCFVSLWKRGFAADAGEKERAGPRKRSGKYHVCDTSKSRSETQLLSKGYICQFSSQPENNSANNAKQVG